MFPRHTAPALSGLLATDLDIALMGPVMMMATPAERVATMQARRDEMVTASEAILDSHDENADLTEEQLETIETNSTEIANLDRQIAALQALVPTGAGRRTTAEPQNRQTPPGNGGAPRTTTVPAQARNNDGKAGFRNFGEFAREVRAAGGDAPNRASQERLHNALTTYGNEGVGQDGGFLVPPEFRREIAIQVMGEESLMARTDRMITAGNSMVLPKDESTPYGGSGIQAYWEAEAGQKRQSKPVFGQNSLRLNKLIALVPVTDELLEDAPGLDSYIRRKTPEVFTARINEAIIAGNGVGKPLGILNSPGTIVVPKVSGQAADTIRFENILAMYTRMRAASLPRAVWLINQSILAQIYSMQFAVGAASPVPVFLPPGGLSQAPYGTLMGRPVVPLEAMGAIGDKGDIIFADMSQYVTLTKGEDIKTDVSIHLFFDYDVTTFRFVFRMTGQPWWSNAVTPAAAGAPTLGTMVSLEERA